MKLIIACALIYTLIYAQVAPQFTAPSSPSISLAQANVAGEKAALDPTSNESITLLAALGMGFFTEGIEQLLPVTPSGFCKEQSALFQPTRGMGLEITTLLGVQFKAGGIGCSSNIIGEMPDKSNMVSTIITLPASGSNFDASINNVIRLLTSNLETGFFSEAGTMYYLQPQTVNDDKIQGHQHIVIQQLFGEKVPGARVFQFFKGVNEIAQDRAGRILEAIVPANSLVVNGVYRICTMSGTNTHQPIISPVLRSGPTHDCIRINVVGGSGRIPIQGQQASIIKSAASALDKTAVIEKGTGLPSPIDKTAALKKIASGI